MKQWVQEYGASVSSRATTFRQVTRLDRRITLSVLVTFAFLLQTGASPASSACPVGGTPSSFTYDVVVVGAGAGGVAAAIQAARMGHQVALLEETDWVGGQMTAAAVSTMDGGDHPRANSGMGIYAEFLDEVRTYYDTQFNPPKSMDTCYEWDETDCFEPHVGRAVLESMLDAEQNIDVCLETSVVDAIVSGNTVSGAETAAGDLFYGHVVLDGTEYGDFIALTPADYRVGNHKRGETPGPNSCVQDITYTMVAREYPNGVPSNLMTPISPPIPGYWSARQDFITHVTANGNHLPCYQDPEWPHPKNAPVHPIDPATHNRYRGLPNSLGPGTYMVCDDDLLSKTVINRANDYPGHFFDLAADPLGRTSTHHPPLTTDYIEDPQVRRTVNCAAKNRTLQFLTYMQHGLGLDDWSLATEEGYFTPLQDLCHTESSPVVEIESLMPLIPYVRESRRIISLQTLTGHDLKDANEDRRADTNFESAVAIGDYNTDLHNCNKPQNFEPEFNEDMSDRSGNRGFQIPFESLIPEAVDGLLPASKSIGTSRLANGAARLQPVEMAIGQAAGAIAGRAVAENVQPRDISIWRVQNELLNRDVGLSLYRFNDVPVSDPDWKAIQITSLFEMIIGDTAGNYQVGTNVHRGLLGLITARMAELPFENCQYQGTFSDVPESSVFHCAIEAIYDAGLTGGCATNPLRFCPSEEARRVQFAIFLVRALGLENEPYPPTPFFNDVPSTHFAFSYVQIARDLGLMYGCGGSSFCPAGTVTRRLAARWIRNFLGWRETH